MAGRLTLGPCSAHSTRGSKRAASSSRCSPRSRPAQTVDEFHPLRLRMRGDAPRRLFDEQLCLRLLALRDNDVLVGGVGQRGARWRRSTRSRRAFYGAVERFARSGSSTRAWDKLSAGERVWTRASASSGLMTGEPFSELERIHQPDGVLPLGLWTSPASGAQALRRPGVRHALGLASRRARR